MKGKIENITETLSLDILKDTLNKKCRVRCEISVTIDKVKNTDVITYNITTAKREKG